MKILNNYNKLLIVNRGEIAIRIIRACRELNIKSVIAYSWADRNANYINLADESICIGGERSNVSYLNIKNIISAAIIKKVNAVHPGYGFLAENFEFAQICEQHNLFFIGPNYKTMFLMGNKSFARKIALKSGVPIVPGSNSVINNAYDGLKIARKIGFPVVLKANGGGGGKGMRFVLSEKTFINDYFTASLEAFKAFNDNKIYIEKYILDPRHIEIQILKDNSGKIIHLWERDCSVQRKYQKIIEEAPSPFINNKLRKDLVNAAIQIVKKCSYLNVGTLEFLVDKNSNFFFIEMNTRLQVEHPVTEMMTGIDIVKYQILIGYGFNLDFNQSDVKIYNHVIECRVNAEDPNNNFFPCPGSLTLNNVLPGGFGVRVDSHIFNGYVIPSFYDSMLAKIITFDKSRTACIKRLVNVLNEFNIKNVKTNINLCIKLLSSSAFLFGKISTNFLDKYLNRIK